MPVGRALDCRCSPGECTTAVFEEGSLDSAIDKDEVLAVVGDYANAIASKKRGGVRFWKGADGALEFAVDVPKTARGEALMETMRTVDVRARPVIDALASDVVIADQVATYKTAEVRALTIGPTDADDGWPALRLADPDEATVPDRRRRLWL